MFRAVDRCGKCSICGLAIESPVALERKDVGTDLVVEQVIAIQVKIKRVIGRWVFNKNMIRPREQVNGCAVDIERIGPL